jgi:anti-sigma factor RsiW
LARSFGVLLPGDLIMPCEVGEDVIEMYVMGSLPDAEPELLEHLEACPSCKARVIEAAKWAESVERAFRESSR